MAIKKKKRVANKKRVMSAAQKNALARGRKALAAKRKSTRKPAIRKTVAKRKSSRKPAVKQTGSNERESIVIINQGESKMAKRKRARRTAVPAKRRKSRSRYMSGGFSGRNIKQVQGLLMSTAVGTAAAVGGSMIIGKIPITNAKLKASMPLLAGIALSMMAKGKRAQLMNQAATGLLIAGGLSLVKQFAPQVALAGEPELYNQAYLDNGAGLGINTDLLGMNTDLMYDEEFAQ